MSVCKQILLISFILFNLYSPFINCLQEGMSFSSDTSIQHRRNLASNCVTELRVLSKGKLDGNSVEFWLNGVSVLTGSGNGFYFVKLNAANTAVEETKRFDTHASYQATKDMTTWINSIPDDRIVAVGVQGDASVRLNLIGIWLSLGQHYAAYDALASLGSDLKAVGWQLLTNDAFALIGQKGKSKGDLNIKGWRAASLIPGKVDITQCVDGCGPDDTLLKVESKGAVWLESKYARYYKNGSKYYEAPGWGTYVKVFDQAGNLHSEYNQGKTNGETDQRNFVNSVPTGYTVVVGCMGGCTGGSLNIDWIYLPCGSVDYSTDLLAGQPWAFIGVKGMASGEAVQNRGGTYAGIYSEYCIRSTKCEPQCGDNNCTGTTDHCDSCLVGSHRINAPTCECESGYYSLGEEIICQLCGFMCSNCTNGADNCTTCSHASRDDSSPQCPCPVGTFSVGTNPECQSCDTVLCGICSETATNCLTCSHEDSRDLSNGCSCKDGYFAVSNQAECPKCDYKCTLCTGTSTACDTCSDVNRLQSDSCRCKDHYFEDGVNNTTCGECDAICGNCSGTSNNCTTCVDNTRDDSTSACLCAIGYWEERNTSCSQCSPACASCTLSTTDCAGNCKATANFNTDCTCQAGYYQHPTTFECIQCTYPCQNCTSETVCTSCVTTVERVDSVSCACNTGFVDNLALCEKCDYGCSECSGTKSDCDVCSDSTTRKDKSKNCACKDKFFENGATLCAQCDPICKTCVGNATNCLICEGDFRDQANGCACETGYFEDMTGDCQKCDSQCETCTGSADSCDSCANPLVRNIFPVCDCKDTYYTDGDECTKCLYPCQNCSGASTCDTCVGQFRDNTYNSCSCIIGYYEAGEGKGCLKCAVQCLTCFGNAFQCTACSRGLNRNTIDVPTCGCLSGYYSNPDDNSYHCKECPSNCSECNDNGQCISCANNGSPPLCMAQFSGFFTMQGPDNTQINAKCEIQCEECDIQVNKCVTCSNGLQRMNNAPLCSCAEGFHDEDGTLFDCIKCPVGCAKCANSQVCQKCENINNIGLDRFKGQCECDAGYKSVPSLIQSLECQKCYTYNQDCLLRCPDSTIQNEEMWLCEDIEIQELDNVNTIILTSIGVIITLIVIAFAMKLFFDKQFSPNAPSDSSEKPDSAENLNENNAKQVKEVEDVESSSNKSDENENQSQNESQVIESQNQSELELC